ncbi:unnamed protein product [Citrullus colocynthis]|uniref:CRIB domain-containing protein n=1 Tax=Citrullus colocynthis TaxID=252529 RepID=A0ABP0Z811_9ROSI
MQIGYPTDVKHVAHIGWDGPSVNSPSWMNEFKSPPSFSSAPLCLPASAGEIKEDVSVKWVSEVDRSRRGERGSNSSARSLEDITKTPKHLSSVESPTCRERSERQKARRSSKSKESASSDQNHSPSLSLPDVPRNGRRKKTSRSKPNIAGETYKSPYSDPGSASSGTGSISISKDTGLCQTP